MATYEKELQRARALEDDKQYDLAVESYIGVYNSLMEEAGKYVMGIEGMLEMIEDQKTKEDEEDQFMIIAKEYLTEQGVAAHVAYRLAQVFQKLGNEEMYNKFMEESIMFTRASEVI